MKIAPYPQPTRSITRGQPTPPIPGHLAQQKVAFQGDNARNVFRKRYQRKWHRANGHGEHETVMESPEEAVWRVAYQIARAEVDFGADDAQVMKLAETFYHKLREFWFVPNSPTWTGAGTPLGQLSACFTLPLCDDMGKKDCGIFSTLRHAALIQQTGGGNGFAFSNLRPKNSPVVSSGGKATGPIGFMRTYDSAFGEIAQGGCLLPDTLVLTEQGFYRLSEIVTHEKEGWGKPAVKASALTHLGTPESISRAYNNGVKPVVRIKTQVGIDLVGTPDHKVYVMTPDGPQWRPLGNLSEGDWIIYRLGGLLETEHDTPENVAMAGLIGALQGGANTREALVKALPPRSVDLLDDADRYEEAQQLAAQGVAPAKYLRGAASVEAYLRGLWNIAGTKTSSGYPAIRLRGKHGAQLAQEIGTLMLALGIAVRVVKKAVVAYGISAVVAWWRTIAQHNSQLPVPSGGMYAASPTLPYPAFWLNPTLASITLSPVRRMTRGTAQFAYRSTAPKLRSILLRYTRHGKRLSWLMYRRLAKAYASLWVNPVLAGQLPQNFVFGQVTHIARGEEERLTLDIEVAGAHSYTANGLIVHNSRRGANMAVLRVDHPDVEDFIVCKKDEQTLTNFNISVGITDDFMRAVKSDAEFPLRFPDVTDDRYRNGSGTWKDAEEQGVPFVTYKWVKARELLERIAHNAWKNGEPGVLFLDTMNSSNPLLNGNYEATNPCGEVPANPGESCTLAAINLSKHVILQDGRWAVDWERLRETVHIAIRFLDNVVQVNGYVDEVPILEEMALKTRKIGLGILGLADMLVRLRLGYATESARKLAAIVMEFIRYEAMLASIDLAKTRGAFPLIRESIYNPADIRWQPPKHNKVAAPVSDADYEVWGLKKPDWGVVLDGIKKHGIRNANQLSIAPTGTTSTVAGVEGYGVEPIFALAYERILYGQENGQERLRYVSRLLRDYMREERLDNATQERIMEHLQEHGTLDDCLVASYAMKTVFATATVVPWEAHILMQAALQAIVDLAISKTINMPSDTTPQDIANAYLMAWELGAKGLTVYRENSRDVVVLKKPASGKGKKHSGAGGAPSKGDGHTAQGKSKGAKKSVGLVLNLSDEKRGGHEAAAPVDEQDDDGQRDAELLEWLKTASSLELINAGYCPSCRNGARIINQSGCASCSACGWSMCPSD